MIHPRTLRPFMPAVLWAIGMTVVVLVLVLNRAGWTTAPFVMLMLIIGLAGGILGERIELTADGVSVHQSGRVILRVPCRTIASLRFSTNDLVIVTDDGLEVTLATSWYTGRQRDAVVSHLRRA